MTYVVAKNLDVATLEQFLNRQFLPYIITFSIIQILTYNKYLPYKAGVFGEVSYDLGIVLLLFATAKNKKGLRYVLILASSFINQSRAIFITISPLFLKLQSNKILILIGIAIFFPISILTIGDRFASIATIDRFIIFNVFVTKLSENIELLWLGQALTGTEISDGRLAWYKETQYNNSLTTLVPANFHGQISRSILLLGLPITLLIFYPILRTFRSIFGTTATLTFLVVLLSQSVFSNPFTGSLLALYLFCEMSTKSK